MAKNSSVKLPILSIVTPTYNAAKLLPRYFTSLERQTVSKGHVEILIVDGGSTDDTREIAKKHGVRIIDNPKKLAEPGVVLGFKEARGKYVMVLATDNIFKDASALETIIKIFEDLKVTAVYPKHDTAPDDSIYSQYINTFTDPFTHFVYGKAANTRTFHQIYALIKHTDTYDIFDFASARTMPLLALAQGFTVRKNEFIRTRDQFDDVLSIYKLIKQGKYFAYAYSVSLYHYTVKNLADFIKKQRRSVENALLRKNSGITKRTEFLTTGQKIRQYLFFPYALTIIVPLLQSLIQAARTRERTWLWHSYISFVSAIILILTTLSV